VRRAEGEPHHILDWKIPAAVGGKGLTIAGSLDYDPVESGGFPTLLVIPLAILSALTVAVWALGARRTRGRTRR
jgi:hypothetical protein